MKNKIIEIDELVKNLYPYDKEHDICPIYDGIINLEQYLKSKFKILWILKEPYDFFDEKGNPCGGGWDLKASLNKLKSINEFINAKKTYIPIIQTSFGILNDFIKCEDMLPITNTLVFDCLKSISIINVKKLPGKKTSNPSEISQAYKDNREILLRQFEVFRPDIIIGGNTLNYFLKDFGLNKNMRIIRKEGSFPYYLKDNKIFISANHPAARLSKKKYCNDIIETVKLWSEKLEN